MSHWQGWGLLLDSGLDRPVPSTPSLWQPKGYVESHTTDNPTARKRGQTCDYSSLTLNNNSFPDGGLVHLLHIPTPHIPTCWELRFFNPVFVLGCSQRSLRFCVQFSKGFFRANVKSQFLQGTESLRWLNRFNEQEQFRFDQCMIPSLTSGNQEGR